MQSLGGLYVIVFRNFNAAVHPPARGVGGMITKGPVSGFVSVGREVVPERINAFAFAPVIFGTGLKFASVALGWPDLDVTRIFENDGDE